MSATDHKASTRGTMSPLAELNAQASPVINTVRTLLEDHPLTVRFVAYFARGPVLSVTAVHDLGGAITHEYPFQPGSDTATQALAAAIHRDIATRFDIKPVDTRTPASRQSPAMIAG